MSKGFGKVQRSIAALIRAEPDGAWAYEHLIKRIYGTDRFARAQKNAIGRALAAMRLPGTWEVWQASFQNDRRLWLFDPCNLESWRKIAAGWDPAHFQPGGVIFGWYKEARSAGPRQKPPPTNGLRRRHERPRAHALGRYNVASRGRN
jgi:hypothetical protein